MFRFLLAIRRPLGRWSSFWPLDAVLTARHPVGRLAPSWPLIDRVATQRPLGHSASARLPETSGPYSAILVVYSRPEHSAPFRLPDDLRANRALLGTRHPSGCSPSQSGLENIHESSWVRSLDPQQWRTGHTNVLDMPWLVEFATPKQCRLTKKEENNKNSWHVGRRVVRRTMNNEKSAKHPGWHRTIRNVLASQAETVSSSQMVLCGSGQDYVR